MRSGFSSTVGGGSDVVVGDAGAAVWVFVGAGVVGRGGGLDISRVHAAAVSTAIAVAIRIFIILRLRHRVLGS